MAKSDAMFYILRTAALHPLQYFEQTAEVMLQKDSSTSVLDGGILFT